MNKIYQNSNNCLQCCISTIYDYNLNNIPDFSKNPIKWINKLKTFFKKEFDINVYFEYNINNLSNEKLLNNYFICVIPSIYIKDGSHAVVIDENLNIIHDPNNDNYLYSYSKQNIIYVICKEVK